MTPIPTITSCDKNEGTHAVELFVLAVDHIWKLRTLNMANVKYITKNVKKFLKVVLAAHTLRRSVFVPKKGYFLVTKKCCYRKKILPGRMKTWLSIELTSFRKFCFHIQNLRYILV